MNRSMLGVSDGLQKECHSSMLHDNTLIIVYYQQEEEATTKSKSKDPKRARSFYGVSSKRRLDTQDKPRFKGF